VKYVLVIRGLAAFAEASEAERAPAMTAWVTLVYGFISGGNHDVGQFAGDGVDG
jgi:hypothetical protein